MSVAQELWNQFGGQLLGLWDDDDDLEDTLSAADKRRPHILLGRDAEGKTMLVYTPTALGDVAEWVGGNNVKRIGIELMRGQITLEQAVSDTAKQVPADAFNKVAQSTTPILKAGYELGAGKATFPDVLDQRTIPKSERWWRFVGTLTDDRIVNSALTYLDRVFYGQPAGEAMQQIILQVRRRDPEQWAYFEAREKVSDWKEARTGKRYEAGDYTAPDAQALRAFRRAIYRGDVDTAERFYGRLLEYGYTAERLESSVRAQHPLSELNARDKREYLDSSSDRDRQQVEQAVKYWDRFGVLRGQGKRLFPPAKFGGQYQPQTERLRELVEQQ